MLNKPFRDLALKRACWPPSLERKSHVFHLCMRERGVPE